MFGLKHGSYRGPIAHRQEIGGTWGGNQNTRVAGLGSGLTAETWVATAMGWRPVETLIRGDLVLTFDRGLQPVRDVTKGLSWDTDTPCPKTLWPLAVPAGALGNEEAMTLLPEQSVMVESDAADALFGDPFALLKAADLDGFRGIERRCARKALEVIQLHFEQDEMVFANAGALVFCPSKKLMTVSDLLELCAGGGYSVLPGEEARMLVACLRDEDAVAGDWLPEPPTGPAYAAALA